MHIRKRSFFEIVFPLTVVFFVCIGTSFIRDIGAVYLRWIGMFLLLIYFFLNKKILVYVNNFWKALLIVYLIWCVSTTLWSEVPILSLSKSTMFALDILVMISAGGLWIQKYGIERGLEWLFFVLAAIFISALMGSRGGASNAVNLYSGVTGNANDFGFDFAMSACLILWRLYATFGIPRKFYFWLVLLVADFYFLLASYSRGSFVVFASILGFFLLSLQLSKKIFILFITMFGIVMMLLMTPVSLLESMVVSHIVKFGGSQVTADTILLSRENKWEKSYQHALLGGMMGGGFAVTIGETDFVMKDISGIGYGREKGNSQFAIMEETGMIGFILSAILVLFFFFLAIPCYFALQSREKILMGIVLGAITGILLESIVEAWWDSSAGPELICFWSFVGVAHGIIIMHRKSYFRLKNHLNEKVIA